MNYTVYDPATGMITQNICCANKELAQANFNGTNYIEGWFPAEQFYVRNGAAVQKPQQPNDPGVVYQFDYTLCKWEIDPIQSTGACREYRDQLLSAVDRVNPVWFASLTADQQQELQRYRQALLDVPQQAGFPTEVEWPAKPAWL